jgi:DMSO/TMAO reductase YedYZ molybdopterin-dependent catalytic subunit
MLSSRRSVLKLLPMAAMAKLRAADMIVRSARPEDFEMPLDGFSTWITPVERFFVRTHVYTPKVEMARWQLRLEGQVAQPLTLSLADLLKFPRAELVSVLECAGNGRAFFRPQVAGLQWENGSVGNARWTGVRLVDVLKKTGYQPNAKEVLFNGADEPIGTMPDFMRAIPSQRRFIPTLCLRSR